MGVYALKQKKNTVNCFTLFVSFIDTNMKFG